MKAKFLIRGFLLIVFGLLLVASGFFSASDKQAKERVLELKQLMAVEIPIGTSKDKIISWGKQHSIQFDPHRMDANRLYSNTGHFPVNGAGFPCSDWNVIVDITLGSNNVSTKQEVYEVGSCI